MSDITSIVPIWQFEKLSLRARRCNEFLHRFGFLTDKEEMSVEYRIHVAVMQKKKHYTSVLAEFPTGVKKRVK